MPVFERDGVSLTYDDSGGTDTPITFLHGLSMSRGSWQRFVGALDDSFRVVRLDQRGHGGSSHPGGYVLDNYVADTIAFLEQIVATPTFIVGHSLGGVIAHAIAAQRPDLVRGILLEDPPLFVVDRMEAGTSREEASRVAAAFPLIQQITRDMQARDAPIAEYETMLSHAPALNGSGSIADVLGPDGVRAMAEALAHLDPEIFTPAIEGSAISGAVDRSARLDVPVIVLRADPLHGPAFSPEDEARFLRANPHGRVVVFEGASHQIHDEQPERFLEELTAFLSSCAA